MASQDQRNVVERLVSKFRRITRVVQFAPYLYLLLYVAVLLGDAVIPYGVLEQIDDVFSITPVIPCFMLIIGKVLSLCRWYRIACLLPMTSTVENIIDTYFFQFTQREVIAINILIAFGVIIFILSSIRHFFYNGRKQTAG